MDDPSRRERFETTILVHLDAAHNLARWLLRDDAAAQDVVQDASVRAFRYFDGMLGPTPKAWFMAIVRRACLDWIEPNENDVARRRAMTRKNTALRCSMPPARPNRPSRWRSAQRTSGSCTHVSTPCRGSSAKC